MSNEMLSYVGSHLGVTDLVLCEEFPPKKTTIADTLLAVIGALQQDQVQFILKQELFLKLTGLLIVRLSTCV